MGDRGHQLIDIPALCRTDCYCVWFIETTIHTGVVDDFGFDSGWQFPACEWLHLAQHLVRQQNTLLCDDLMLKLHLFNTVRILRFSTDLFGRQDLSL